jgi:UDP-N-acetylglucosamine--N-acetylmuramyl-(pentapeptide) pyrophosphoryl-undecaprenol N-acetylglucosamine transferase
VVSAGSFVSVPVAYAARALGIPQVLLQMDVLPGLANRLMAPASSALGYYFPASERAFQRIPERQHVGPVVRNSIYQGDPEQANQRFQLNPDLPVLLITGGGQGAVGLNRAIQPLLPTWQKHFQVIHLTGRGGAIDLAHGPRYQTYEFVNEGMGDLLARSQLIITRAGLGILGELSILGKDVILIPLPNSHQELNASTLAESGAITLLNQQELAENGLQWWSKFWSTYQPSITGQRMQSYWPPQGTTTFASLIRQQGLRVS